ncbi:hypothetical protein HETIRDRAFT_107400 [Heterobasidion irregulare TC 32-1]|uniref:Uncharacterized protein n=1 Tax=Heterobasidion irregulare (strain TC 32-1) TaxID=747525 RepID=W4JVZ8_HETIT|nr:uncharacterized protein HETIRDRAFT_107400 [Heterobasidion irregulare TC 32-1]ETW77733.1 hypothetical protein HETIRDRAFT_107400 [Heterobasidion irregulare TC 32-1]
MAHSSNLVTVHLFTFWVTHLEGLGKGSRYLLPKPEVLRLHMKDTSRNAALLSSPVCSSFLTRGFTSGRRDGYKSGIRNGTPMTHSAYVECHLGAGDGPGIYLAMHAAKMVGQGWSASVHDVFLALTPR